MGEQRLSKEEIYKLLTETQVRNEESNLRRVPMNNETHLMDCIRRGNYQDIAVLPYLSMSEHIGHWSQDEMKIWEYNSVAYISGFARAAVAGGLEPDKAMDLSDVMLSKVAQAKTIEQLHDITELAARNFAQMVHESQLEKSSYLIEQCKNYIGRNVLHKIYLAEIADYVGLNPTYLSRVFSQKEGISIQSYIQKEKVEAACNMLRYSEYSISDIAQYVGFSSQSSFTVVFKKWKNMTPMEYRNQNKCRIFS